MYIDNQTQSYLNGENLGSSFLTRNLKRAMNFGTKKPVKPSGFSRMLRRQVSKSRVPTMGGTGFLLNNGNGPYLNGWLTDLTKPVSNMVRSVSSAGLSVVRTGVKAAAPAVVSAITGRPVNVTSTPAQQYDQAAAQQISASGPDSRMLLYGGAAVLGLGVLIFAMRPASKR